MKLAGRIAVEPLDEERLSKIERRVVAGAAEAAAQGRAVSGRGRLAGFAAAAALAVAGGVIGWMLRGAPASGPVAGEPAPVGVDTASGKTVVDIGDARLVSDPATRFTVSRPAGGVVVAMTRGKLELEVGKRGDRPPLVVRAGDTDVVVVGTRFSVDYGDGHGAVDVQVSEGVVRVVRQRDEVRVAAGQRWQSGSGLVASVTATEAAHPATPATSPVHDGTTAARDPQVAVGTPPELNRRHVAVVPDGPAPATSTRRTTPAAPVRTAIATGAPARRAPASHVSDGHIDLRAEIRALPVEPALDLGEADPTAAIAKYYEIAAHRSGDEASQAFYSIAVVRHHRLGRNADALLTLDQYVRRFPGGKEYRAAIWLRIRILCLDKIDDRCRAAAYTYLHEAPDGPAARVAGLLTLTQ